MGLTDAEIFNAALSPEPWVIDKITYENQILEIVGWALAPHGRHDWLTFTINDFEFEEIVFPIERPALAELFWFKPGCESTGYRCRLSIEPTELFRGG